MDAVVRVDAGAQVIALSVRVIVIGVAAWGGLVAALFMFVYWVLQRPKL